MVLHALRRYTVEIQCPSTANLTIQTREFIRIWVWLIFMGCCAGGFAAPDDVNSLKKIDVFFRSTYNQAREHTLRDTGPIIIASGEDLTLLYAGKEITGTPPPPGYRALTTISHITLSLFLLLEPYGEGRISSDRLEQLQQLSRLAKSAKVTVTEYLADDLQLAEDQKTVIDKSCSLIDKIVAEKKWAANDLAIFLERVKPQILQNVKLAAKFRIDHFHNQMITWKRNMSEREWDRLRVIVSGAAMPRKNNLAVQYFSKLFGVRGEGLKITYAESVFSQKRALQILGTNLLDTQIGVGYFGDPWRMHRDLLGNAAAVYLDGMTLAAPETQRD